MCEIHLSSELAQRQNGLLKNYSIVDNTGKIHHQLWLNKVGQMYSDELSMKTSLLHALMLFTLSQIFRIGTVRYVTVLVLEYQLR